MLEGQVNVDLEDLQSNWDALGKADPLWAILKIPGKGGNRWQVDEFFKTGSKEIDSIMEYVSSLGVSLTRQTALDFGCGVGRLTQALAGYFDRVYGVDLAPSMLELAKKYNKHGDRCNYVLNETDDLILFMDNTFDFIYTNIVLQHMEPEYSKRYIKEFLRVIAPGGLIIFQLPSEPIDVVPAPRSRRSLKGTIRRQLPRFLLDFYRTIRGIPPPYAVSNGEQPKMEMHGIMREDVERFLKENGAMILDIVQDFSAGRNWSSFRYCIAKNDTHGCKAPVAG